MLKAALVASIPVMMFCAQAHAEPVTIYTNQSSWQAAVSGDSIGAYAGTVDENETVNGQPFYSLQNAGFQNFEYAFNGVETVAFSQPISGFESDDASDFGDYPNPVAYINGSPVPELFGSFLGIVGNISSLTFTPPPCCTDEFNRVVLDNIQVAIDPPGDPVPEPKGIGYAVFAFGTLFMLWRRAR